MNNAKVTLDGDVTVNLKYIDNRITDYALNSLDITKGTMNLAVDTNAYTGNNDTITTATESNGTITINGINFVNSGVAGFGGSKTFKILNTNEGLELALDKTKYIAARVLDEWSDVVTSDVNVVSNSQFRNYSQEGDLYHEVELATTSTTNDSIKITYNLLDFNGEVTDAGSMGDTLALWNTTDVTETVKNFNFTAENQTYTAVADAGVSTADTININGYSDGKSVIDFNGNNGFELDNATTLNLNNVKLTGNTNLITISNSDADVNLKNATLDGSISSAINYDLNVSGNTAINGTVDNAVVTMTGADSIFTIGSDTLKNASLTATSGTLNLADNSVNTTYIDKLTTSASGVTLNIDIDAQDSSNITADLLNLGSASNGTITLGSVNFVNDVAPGSVFEVPVIATTSSAVQLSVADSVSGTTYSNIGTATADFIALNGVITDELSTVNDTVNSNDLYENWSKTGAAYGSIALSDTNPFGIKLKVDGTNWDEASKKLVNKIDALSALTQKETSNDRNFNFATENETYTVTENLGSTTAGTLNINGYSDGKSVIDLNGKNGFELDNATTLNLNDVKLTGNTNLITISNSDADVNLSNTILDGSISSAISYDLNVSGNTAINGTVDNAVVTMTGADSNFAIGSDTLKNASLTAASGTLNLADNSVNTTYIDTLTTTSASGLTLNIDINAADSSNVKADLLNLGSASNGTITLGSVNFVNEVAPGSVFEVPVIATTSSAVQLSVADSVSGTTYSNIGTNTADFVAYNGVITDELPAVNDTVNSNDLYEIWNKTGSLYGSIALSSTNPFAIELKVDGTDWDEASKKLVKKIDVLAALTQKETPNDRNFNFVTEDETYTVTENLGSATAGTLNINGYTDGNSVIDLDGNNGFELDNATTLNLNDVKLTGNDNLITVNNTNAEVNLNNVNLDGNIVSSNTYNLGINGNTTLNGSVGDAAVTVNPGTDLTLTSNDHFQNADVTLNNGATLNLINNSTQTQLARSFSVVGDIIMNIDADLAKSQVDRLPPGTTVASTAAININRINLLSDAVSPVTRIQFAESSYSDNVKYTGPGIMNKSPQFSTV